MTDPTAPDPLAAPVNPPAKSAGEEDHTDPWSLAGEDADPPADTGRPPEEG